MAKIGRPKLPKGQKKQFKIVGVYKDTHKRIKSGAEQDKLSIAEYIDKKIV